jgi:hypothetical protein
MKVLIMLFVGLLVCTPVGASADYSDGLYQYLRGQYSNALNEFTPLANEGNPEAQYALFFKNVRKIYVFLMSHIHRQSLCDLA